jgi:periplasmic nitrate reductase NapD
MRNVRVKAHSAELHITSFVVQHRAEAATALAGHIAKTPQLELAIPGDVRSVVLCEGENQYEILDRIEALRAIPGVLNVTLVYHHAEPREALEAPMATEAGATP